MNTKQLLAIALLGLVTASANAAPPSFQAETARATKELSCPRPKITAAAGVFGAFYECVAGKAQTIRFILNEEPAGGAVKNIKLIWKDRVLDIGYGVHDDKAEADQFLAAFVRMYASDLAEQLPRAFAGSNSKQFDTADYRIEFIYGRGTPSDERVLVATPKK